MYEYAKKLRTPLAAASKKRSVPTSVQTSINSINNVDVHSGTKLSLEDGLKSRIEKSIGYKLDGVEMRESHDALDMDAKAFAKGNVVHFAPGHFRPDTEEGRNLITHELSHVAQQARGGVHADIAGVNVNTSEALESQADSTRLDFSAPADTSALPSLPSMDAQVAPVQGAFGRIKKFFSNMKKSFGFGKKAKAFDDVTSSINSEHQAETDEMMKAMQSQGFSPEEIEAQLLFQRLNKNEERGSRFQEAQGALTEYGMNANLDSGSQMDNIFARVGRGKLTQGSVKAAGDMQNHVLYNVLTGREEEDRANALTTQIGQKYADKNKARENLEHMSCDGRSAEGDRYLNARFGKDSHGALTESHKFRLFLRQSYGKTDAEKDEMYDIFTNSNRNGEYLDFIKQLTDKSMAMDMDWFNTPDDHDMVEKSNGINDATTDIMALSDVIKDNAQALGYSDRFISEDFGSRRQYLMATKTNIRARQRELTGEAAPGSAAQSPSAKTAFGETGKNQGFEDFKSRYIAANRLANRPDKQTVAKTYNPIATQQAAAATNEQNQAAIDYIRDSRDINNYMRTGKAATGKEAQLETMKQNLEGRMSSLSEDQMSYRSISDVGLLPIIEQLGLTDVIKPNGMIDHMKLMSHKDQLKGTVFKDNAFVSTTSSPEFAEKWGANLARRDKGVFNDRALQRHKFTDEDMALPNIQSDIDLYNNKSLSVGAHNQTSNFLADRVLKGDEKVNESDIGTHMMEILMPKGAKASYIDGAQPQMNGNKLGDHTIDSQQFEVLLNHGSHFKIADIVHKLDKDGKAIPNQFRIMLELLKEEEEEK